MNSQFEIWWNEQPSSKVQPAIMSQALKELALSAWNASMRDYSDVWLMQKLWTDPMENHPSKAMGYDNAGVVVSESEANRIIEEGGFIEDKGWPIMGKAPKYKKRRLYSFRKETT